jgi:hypothetical protein
VEEKKQLKGWLDSIIDEVAFRLSMILFHAALFEVFKGVMLKNKELPCEEEEERAKPLCFKGRILW